MGFIREPIHQVVRLMRHYNDGEAFSFAFNATNAKDYLDLYSCQIKLSPLWGKISPSKVSRLLFSILSLVHPSLTDRHAFFYISYSLKEKFSQTTMLIG